MITDLLDLVVLPISDFVDSKYGVDIAAGLLGNGRGGGSQASERALGRAFLESKKRVRRKERDGKPGGAVTRGVVLRDIRRGSKALLRTGMSMYVTRLWWM